MILAVLVNSLLSGKASVFPDHQSSFVDGMGGKQVLPEMWSYVNQLVDSSVVVTLQVYIHVLISSNMRLSHGECSTLCMMQHI